jgi:hypothetical protein
MQACDLYPQSVFCAILFYLPGLQSDQSFVPQGLLHRQRTLAEGFSDLIVEILIVETGGGRVVARSSEINSVEPRPVDGCQA